MATEDEIKKTLRRLGVKTSNFGYSYVSYGISLTLRDKSYLEYVTKNLYVDIAHNFHTSGSCVERDIRTVIEAIWKTDDTELLMEICDGASTERKPANKKFFSMMHAYFSRLSNEAADKANIPPNPDFSCAKLGGECTQLKDLYEELGKLKEKYTQLENIVLRDGQAPYQAKKEEDG